MGGAKGEERKGACLLYITYLIYVCRRQSFESFACALAHQRKRQRATDAAEREQGGVGYMYHLSMAGLHTTSRRLSERSGIISATVWIVPQPQSKCNLVHASSASIAVFIRARPSPMSHSQLSNRRLMQRSHPQDCSRLGLA